MPEILDACRLQVSSQHKITKLTRHDGFEDFSLLIRQCCLISDPDLITSSDNSERIQLDENSEISRTHSRRATFRQRSLANSRDQRITSTPRTREVLLSKISLYIVYMFVCCHRFAIPNQHFFPISTFFPLQILFFSVRIIPTVYELIWTYSKPDDKENADMPWPPWVAGITNVR